MSNKSLVDDSNNHRVDCKDGGPTRDRLSTSDQSLKAAWYDYLWIFGSVGFYIADVVTDILVSLKYFRNGDHIWFSLTLACVMSASLVMMMFSLKWYYEDTAEEASKATIVVLHVLQLGPLQRYWEYYRSARRSRKETPDRNAYSIYIEQWRDIAMLRLFEVFIESAPQMVLQLYILAYNRHFDKDNDWLTALSACFSLISLASSIVSYSKAQRDASKNKGKMTWWAFACQIAWRITMVASRIVTLVLFASVYTSWIFLFICLHWFLMAFWIRWQKPSFGSKNKILKFMFPIVVGFIYVFCFFNVKDGFTRKRLILFYALMFVENCVLMGAWLPYRHEYGVVFVAALGTVFGGFFIGVIALVLYYHCYHPSLSIQGIIFRTSHDVPTVAGIVERKICCCVVRSYEDEDEESLTPKGKEILVDIRASKGSLRPGVAQGNRTSSRSPPLESELLYHKPSQLQKQYSLDREKIKREKAERAKWRHSSGNVVENGVTKSVVVASERRSLPKEIEMNQIRGGETRRENGHVCSVDIHTPRDRQPNDGHCTILVNSHVPSERHNSSSVVNIDPDLQPTHNIDLNYNRSNVIRNDGHKIGAVVASKTCNDGIHCGTDDEKETEACDDGIHCGTDDEQETGTCDDGVHCGTDNERDTGTCDDGIHCGTDDEKETGTCDDGKHCGTDDEKETGTCDDGIHCGTDDEKETGTCDDGKHCGTDDEKETATCDDGIHCGTDDEKETGTCDDGIHCGTDDEKETATCDDGIHCGTDDEKETGTCDDGKHCGTDDEKETGTCDDGIHCGTDDEKETETCDDGKHCGKDNEKEGGTCDDGIHCGTDDEEETGKCNNGVSCGTDDRKESGTCDDGIHCGTDDEEDTKAPLSTKRLPGINHENIKMEISKAKHSKTLQDTEGSLRNCPTGETLTLEDSDVSNVEDLFAPLKQLSENSDSVKFHHRYSIVSDCISLSSSNSSENEESKYLGKKRDWNDGSFIYKYPHSDVTDSNVKQFFCQDESEAASGDLQCTLYTESFQKRYGAKQSPIPRSNERRSKRSNRISFPNFVATNLRRGRFSSLRNSREDCTKRGEDTRRHTVDFSLLTSESPEALEALSKTLKPKKFGSVRDKLEELHLD
ncbi:uncharacterized protein LOC114534698 [Dendronephthya gigantea]|uniref:uncharacterized protein LOC114534698 n=1 Tax=Dendronephthya gigantea TaxID=151771 RepID=UPI00106ACEAA|nr:uncharacterized protein LOC114534698 [Dendronephthya gigantea]